MDANGAVVIVYCHKGGYPTERLPLLLEHYNDISRARDIIALGDLSYLAPGLRPTRRCHCFDSPQKGVTVAYARDRGEDGCEARGYPTMESYRNELAATGWDIEYVYLYDEDAGRWYWGSTSTVVDGQEMREANV